MAEFATGKSCEPKEFIVTDFGRYPGIVFSTTKVLEDR